MTKRPTIYVIAGPNGSGKTTFAQEFLPNYEGCTEFVNADSIAKGLSPFSPERAAIKAGRLVLQSIHQLSSESRTFGFETTLSGRGYVRLLSNLKAKGYSIAIYFLWVRSIDLALKRISDRVKHGGHNVPEVDVRRRFASGMKNFLSLYWPLADVVTILDNSTDVPRLVAMGDSDRCWARESDLMKEFEKNAGVRFKGEYQ